MSQEIAHRDPRFSRLGELGPVARDGCVEVEQAGLDEPEGADGGDRFPDGVEVDDRVAVPGSRPRGVGVSRPQVDNRALFDVDGEGGNGREEEETEGTADGQSKVGCKDR